MKNKQLFKGYDTYLQKWLYCYAYSLNQAIVLLRNQALKINGKYSFQQIIKDKQ